jgi:hypothetical protein
LIDVPPFPALCIRKKIGRRRRIPGEAIRKQEGTALAASADEHGPGEEQGEEKTPTRPAYSVFARLSGVDG